MTLKSIFEQSDVFAEELHQLIAVPLYNDSRRLVISDVSSSLSIEHWYALRILLREGMFPSAVVILRAQYEALIRSIWLLYAASDAAILKLSNDLSTESEQAAKNTPNASDMLLALKSKGHIHVYDALMRFKNSSWKALNSYVHAGVHPLKRHEEGYPEELIRQVLRSSNSLAAMAGIQTLILSGMPTGQKMVLELCDRYRDCMTSYL